MKTISTVQTTGGFVVETEDLLTPWELCELEMQDNLQFLDPYQEPPMPEIKPQYRPAIVHKLDSKGRELRLELRLESGGAFSPLLVLSLTTAAITLGILVGTLFEALS